MSEPAWAADIALEDREFRARWHADRAAHVASEVDDPNRWSECLPPGSWEKRDSRGVITVWDPVTRATRDFVDVHARNAWISMQVERGAFVRSRPLFPAPPPPPL